MLGYVTIKVRVVNTMVSSRNANPASWYSIAVRKPKRYGTPLRLKEVSGSAMPPQSCQYLI